MAESNAFSASRDMTEAEYGVPTMNCLSNEGRCKILMARVELVQIYVAQSRCYRRRGTDPLKERGSLDPGGCCGETPVKIESIH